MRRVILWLFIAAVFVIALLYHWLGNSGSDLNVQPDAAREIEKAKRR